jgi:transposase-like protein
MTCHNCKIEAVKAGKDKKGNQRFKCQQCKRRFQEERERLLGAMNLNEDKAVLCLTLLLEGMSIRAIERTTGVGKKTIINLMLLAGDRCQQLMNQKIKNVPRVFSK